MIAWLLARAGVRSHSPGRSKAKRKALQIQGRPGGFYHPKGQPRGRIGPRCERGYRRAKANFSSSARARSLRDRFLISYRIPIGLVDDGDNSERRMAGLKSPRW
jgi:hypothetical protein